MKNRQNNLQTSSCTFCRVRKDTPRLHEIAKAEQWSHIREMATWQIWSSSRAAGGLKEKCGPELAQGREVQVNDPVPATRPAKNRETPCPYTPIATSVYIFNSFLTDYIQIGISVYTSCFTTIILY